MISRTKIITTIRSSYATDTYSCRPMPLCQHTRSYCQRFKPFSCSIICISIRIISGNTKETDFISIYCCCQITNLCSISIYHCIYGIKLCHVHSIGILSTGCYACNLTS